MISDVIEKVKEWVRQRFGKVVENARCPACGYRRGRIKWIEEQKVIAHECLVCSAIWGENPIVKPDIWVSCPDLPS